MKNLHSDFKLGKKAILNFIGLNNKDKTLVRKMRNNPLIRKWMYSKKIISLKEHLGFFSKLRNSTHDFYWLVKINNEYLGVIYLNRFDKQNKHAYLGIYANPASFIKGKGSQLMQCLKYIGFKKANLKTIKLEVIEDNRNAINFYKKNDFSIEGKLRQYVFSGKDWKDVLIMGTNKEQAWSLISMAKK